MLLENSLNQVALREKRLSHYLGILEPASLLERGQGCGS